MKKCEKCGAELNDNTKFCNICGAPAGDASKDSNGPDKTVNVAPQPNARSAINQDGNGNPQYAQSPQPQYVQPQYVQPQNGQPQNGQPQNGQPYYSQSAQPQYVQPVYYQQPVYVQQPVIVQQPVYSVKKPPVIMDPRDALLKAASSGKFLTGMIFHFAAFFMNFFALFSLSAFLTAVAGLAVFDELASSKEINDMIGALSGTSLIVLVVVISIPLLALISSIIISFIGGKKKNIKIAKVGLIILFVMLIFIQSALVIFPLFLTVISATGGFFTSSFLAVGLVLFAFSLFFFLPSILVDMKAIRILNGREMQKYTFPVVPVSLIIMGVFTIIASIGFFIIFQWLYALAIICLGVSCFIFASVVIGYNKDAKYAVKQY